jgi:hypothetical protein
MFAATQLTDVYRVGAEAGPGSDIRNRTSAVTTPTPGIVTGTPPSELLKTGPTAIAASQIELPKALRSGDEAYPL